MIKEILKKTLILSAIIIFVVFLISYLFFDAPKDILIVFEILLLSFLIVSLQQILRRNLFETFLLNIIIEYIVVSIFVLLYGYFFQWFLKANWWMVFLYVAIVYIPAYLLDVVIVKRDIDYINAQLERRWNAAVKKRKLNYRFHNPNPPAATADYILKILIEGNSQKVENAIQEATNQDSSETECDEGHLA